MMPDISRKHILCKLFFSTLYLSAFTFGGGYVIVSLMKNQFVDELHWIDETEMLDLIAIAQSCPGAVAVNGAIAVGYQLGGPAGVLVSVFGAVLPPFVILSAVSGFYTLFRDNPTVRMLLAGMRAGIAAVIVSVVWDMAGGIVRNGKPLPVLLMAASFLANIYFHINIVLLICLCVLAVLLRSIVSVLLGRRKDRTDKKGGERR